jgi:hypothetical protein
VERSELQLLRDALSQDVFTRTTRNTRTTRGHSNDKSKNNKPLFLSLLLSCPRLVRVFRVFRVKTFGALRRPGAVIGLSLALVACSGNHITTPLVSKNDPFLDTVQVRTFHWFWDNTDASTGLTPDRWPTRTFSSVAAIGFGLSAYIVGAERGYVTRADAATRTLNTLRYLYQLPQGPGTSGVAGYKGFFYHFLNFGDGLRFQQVELSTIDTALLLGGVLSCQSYFDGASPIESAIRAYADSLYRRVDWTWAQNHPPLISMGWHPENGFIGSDWGGYNEGMIIYILALGSPTHPVAPEAWTAWTQGYPWATYYGQTHVNFAPLFGHQYSHVWVDFRGIQDAYMRGKGIDYFENSRRATIAQHEYAIANPSAWRDYSASIWGLTASDGPYDTSRVVDGRTRQFHTYWARGAAATEQPDDGTIAPTAVGGSVPFAPEITVPALKAMRRTYGDNLFTSYGFLDAFNPTYRSGPVQAGHIVPNVGWFDVDYLGIDQGPILLMIENFRTGLLWNVMKKNTYVRTGLERAGFTGGWLQ